MEAVPSTTAPAVRLELSAARLVTVGLVTVALAAALIFALGPLGGSPAHRPSRAGHAGHSLSRLVVPVDATERQWRATVRSLPGPPASPAAVARLRRRVLAVAAATGATVVRMRIWHRTTPAAVEVVLATRMRPAVYLLHRAKRLMEALQRPDFVKVVTGHGNYFFESGGVANEGFVGVPPSLYYCQPISTGMPPPYRACPAK